MKHSVTDEPVEQYLDSMKCDNLAPLIQQHVIDMLNQALRLSQSVQREDKESIHDLRVDFKHLRAYWRLVRALVDKAEFEAADQRIKIAAKALGGQRDQQVLLDSLFLMTAQLSDSEKTVSAPLFQELKRPLAESRQDLSIDWPAINSTLHSERSAWQKLNCASKENPIKKGLRKSFKRYIDLSQQASHKQADMAQRHRWRKWVKYLFYQLNLLRHLGLKGQKKTVKRLDELGELLGVEHDLEILETFLASRVSPAEESEIVTLLVKTCRQYKKGVRKQIKELAQRLNHLS